MRFRSPRCHCETIAERRKLMARRLHLFEAAGLELEYMVVRTATGAVAPVVDRLMTARCGSPVTDCRLGRCEASNELAAHVFELKVPRPVSITKIPDAELAFARAVTQANQLLKPEGCRLLPGPMHPTMSPRRESTIWPHEGREIYEQYDRIFDCHGHGWFNLQSCHINLPFADDREFGLLHAAIILLLPFLPALAAGSPFRESRVTGWRDTRLDTYRKNQKRFPLIAGQIVPEPVFSESEYREKIFAPLMRQVSEVNRDGLLQDEWLNSRGAIARFDRGAIEIRVLDVQECPKADMAIASVVIAALRDVIERCGTRLLELARASATRARQQQLLGCARHGLDAPLQLDDVRRVFRVPAGVKSVRGFWRHVLRHLPPLAVSEEQRSVVGSIIERGNLADRMLRFQRGRTRGRAAFQPLLEELADCLADNRMFRPR